MTCKFNEPTLDDEERWVSRRSSSLSDNEQALKEEKEQHACYEPRSTSNVKERKALELVYAEYDFFSSGSCSWSF